MYQSAAARRNTCGGAPCPIVQACSRSGPYLERRSSPPPPPPGKLSEFLCSGPPRWKGAAPSEPGSLRGLKFRPSCPRPESCVAGGLIVRGILSGGGVTTLGVLSRGAAPRSMRRRDESSLVPVRGCISEPGRVSSRGAASGRDRMSGRGWVSRLRWLSSPRWISRPRSLSIRRCDSGAR